MTKPQIEEAQRLSSEWFLQRTVRVEDDRNTTKVGTGTQSINRVEGELTDAYLALIVQRIRESLVRSGVTDLREALIEFNVSTTGVISNARIVTGSGSGSFDAAVLEAFRSIRPIGPPPTGRAESFQVTIYPRP